MNRTFENIFEKYNIHRDVPKKRYKSLKNSTQTLPLHKKEHSLYSDSSILSKSVERSSICNSVPNTRKSLNSKSACYFNTNSRAKYYNPTRYKTLDIIGVAKVCKHSKSISESSAPISKNNNLYDGNSKENYNEQISSSFRTDSHTNAAKPSDCSRNESINNYKKNYLLDSLNLPKRNKQSLLCKRDNVKPIDKSKSLNASVEKQRKCKCVTLTESNDFLTEPIQSCGNSRTKPSETKTTRILTTQTNENSPTELDLLIDLIVQEEKCNKTVVGHKQKGKPLNYDDSFQRTKPCLKGGYQELFERALRDEKIKSNFLKYDKKIGLRSGQLLTVVKIETSYGVTLATVKSKDLNRNFAIVVPQEMAVRLKLGAEIEAFFDDKSLPYKLQLNGECLDVYLEPYKLLLV